ncbi:MAG: polysaccharide deacetylase family protein [Gemmatimonadetes bacterium]|nr:polysaccharide deacetylase family protein [Gemmatimonadota bacterium]
MASVATEAAPRLADHGLAATVFVVSDHVGGDNRWDGDSDSRVPPQPVLGWDALGTLVDAGWCVGSHTKRHPRLTRCSDAELEDELAGASATIAERLGAAPATLAYPYGDVDLRVQRAAATHYRVGCTTRHLPVTSAADPHAVPRLDAWYFRGRDPFRAWGTTRFRNAVAWRHALRRARRLWA